MIGFVNTDRALVLVGLGNELWLGVREDDLVGWGKVDGVSIDRVC